MTCNKILRKTQIGSLPAVHGGTAYCGKYLRKNCLSNIFQFGLWSRAPRVILNFSKKDRRWGREGWSAVMCSPAHMIFLNRCKWMDEKEAVVLSFCVEQNMSHQLRVDLRKMCQLVKIGYFLYVSFNFLNIFCQIFRVVCADCIRKPPTESEEACP